MVAKSDTAKPAKVEAKTITGRVPVKLLTRAEDIAFTENRARKVSELLTLALTEYVNAREPK